MPTVVIQPGATIFVTGVNGLIGSVVADQLLARGYNVRGAVRGVEKNKWLAEYFHGKYKSAKFDLVDVPDMTVEGCYDGLVDGTEGFIHLASPVGGIQDLNLALDIGRAAGLSALKACAKTPSVTRFVNTSSSAAATMPKPHLDHDFIIDEKSFNDEALQRAKSEDTPTKGFLIYASMKSETEKAMWKWVAENKPGFVLNCILPNANFGPVLIPDQQGFPSTIEWAHAAWTGETITGYASVVDPQWFIATLDSALLHISALIHSDVNGERLFGFVERWNFNDLLRIFRKHYPGKTFAEDIEGLGEDKVRAPTKRAEEVLRWVKGAGWDGLEDSVVAMAKDW